MVGRTRVLGIDAMNRKIRVMDRRIKDAIREALEESAEEVVAMMKRLVPIDDGDLRDSIGWTFGQPPTGSISVGGFGGDEMNAQGLRVTIFAGSAKAFYARWVEFGTVQHPAQPFFFVAWRALRRRIKGRVTRKMNKAIKQVANG